MFDKLESIERRFVALEESLLQPGLDGKELTRLSKERSEIEELVEKFRRYKAIQNNLAETKELLATVLDSDMKAMAEEELETLKESEAKTADEIKMHMLPKDPRDTRNVVLEIRAGTGGDEAGIFAGDLLRMYSRFAEKQNWKMEFLNVSEAPKGGYKEVVALIEGKNVFSRLKFESGAHRVQRVPETEAQGRIHTSACTVAVLPEAEDVDVVINPADLRIDTYRSSGAGGQHINTTDSAVRITHIPTGVVAECQDERSQFKNRDKAMKMLKTRLLDKMQSEQEAEQRAERKSQVGSGDRSERIRTYNYPQGRMTDHRINLTMYSLSSIMEGDIGDILDALGAFHTAELLKSQAESKS